VGGIDIGDIELGFLMLRAWGEYRLVGEPADRCAAVFGQYRQPGDPTTAKLLTERSIGFARAWPSR
jgi:hypothetical protein